MKPLKLKMIGILILSGVVEFTSTEALALEDSADVVGSFNWIPTNPAVREDPLFRSVQKHNIHRIQVSTLPTGKFQLLVTLPEDLSAGASTVLVLTETSRNLDNAEYKFSGVNGNFSCIVFETWKEAGCEVEFYNLGMSQQQQQEFLTNKYNGTNRANGQGLLVRGFGAEPIGSIAFSDPEFFTPGHQQGNGLWNTTYSDSSGRPQQARMSIDFEKGMYKAGSYNGTLSGLTYDGSILEGQWSMGGQMGWIKFNFNDQIDDQKFQGTWGRYDDLNHVLGYWNGTRIPQ